ncbi:DUF1848 domain-containing protein [Paratractidigestivibacter sp.]|uniref:DUF1848 domain-containing protein n=1 Tax=Paratractidigestivibacter sp. TaxID=2847316 RepID=UPI002ABDE694|nr:DUF1848 domain-containing protein [Paratractidigestivibacter sp.]
MILNTGCRTDIPAYFSEWFCRRVAEGYVMARNPYRPELVTRYVLDPQVVDVICFCTKNPAPMLPRLGEFDAFRQFWFVTCTSYGAEIEPNVPDKAAVLASIRQLSGIVGPRRVGWRYDPVFLSERYTAEHHLRAFERMAAELGGRVAFCVVSFIDLYEKTRRNFPEARAVRPAEQRFLATEFARIGAAHGIRIRLCCEDASLAECGVDVNGCMTREVLEQACDIRLDIPCSKRSPRAMCDCLLGADVGTYNTCPHGCAYCYANYDQRVVARNLRLHDPASPLLIGHIQPGDIVRDAHQESYLAHQLPLF